MEGLTIPLVALAGVVSFASPCFLPIVPVYVTYVAGAGPAGEPALDRRRAALQALTFVVGFTAVFVTLWASIGLIGYALGDHRALLRVLGGVILVVLGLHLAGLIELSTLLRTRRAPLNPLAAGPAAPTYRRSLLLGIAFAAGWTPCIGPVLGGVIGLATASDSVLTGALLMLTYSLGLGLPFVLVAVGAREVTARLGWLQRHHEAVSLVSGLLLIALGFLMITDQFGRLAGLVPQVGL